MLYSPYEGQLKSNIFLMKHPEVSVHLSPLTTSSTIDSTSNDFIQYFNEYYYNSNKAKEILQISIFVNSNEIQQSKMRKVCYLYNEDIIKYQFSKEHPMKTKRMKMVHSMIKNYGLSNQLKLYHSREATAEELCQFHNPHYVKYLESWVSPRVDLLDQRPAQAQRLKMREDAKLNSIFKINQTVDCPGFEGLYDFCRLAAGGSLDAADLIIAGEGDIVINWSGGYHHAKKTQASGFCYINDIVLCILELLKVYPRVLYLDIDVHHGDGVQEAFYHTNRVLTVSFHEFQEDFFPGTGALQSVGEGVGKYYTINIPLHKGMDDISYLQLFKKIMSRVCSFYVPDVMVIQCGADSLSRDKLGHLNLSIKGHGELLTYMKSFGVPMVLLGGGGYTIENVARCWTYETGLMLGRQIENQIPKHDYYYYYYGKEGNRIHFDVQTAPNMNDKAYLDQIVETVYENLKQAQIRPCVAFHSTLRHYAPTQQNDWMMVAEEENSLTDDLCQKFFKKI